MASENPSLTHPTSRPDSQFAKHQLQHLPAAIPQRTLLRQTKKTATVLGGFSSLDSLSALQTILRCCLLIMCVEHCFASMNVAARGLLLIFHRVGGLPAMSSSFNVVALAGGVELSCCDSGGSLQFGRLQIWRSRICW